MTFKMRALQTFSGKEGLVKKGNEFKVTDKNRAVNLEKKKLAIFVEKAIEEKKDHVQEAVEPLAEEENKDELIEEVGALKTHKQLDEYAKLIEIPKKQYPKDGKVADKQKAILAFLGIE